MKLRCHQLKGTKCPRYTHQGIFHPTNKMVKPLLPDLRQCAGCIAHAAPQRSDLRDDLFQLASLTLIEKGHAFNPTHHSGASFGTFIRPRICGTLMNEKSKELTHSNRELPTFERAGDSSEDPEAEVDQDVGRLWEVPDPHAEFEAELVRDISSAAALPKLMKILTPREREIFGRIREHQHNCEIAEALHLSESRISQLVGQITLKLSDAAHKLGLAE